MDSLTPGAAPGESPLAAAPLPGLILSLAVPAVLSQLITLGYTIVDRIYLGHTVEGVAAITAVGVCVPVTLLLLALVNLFARGGAPLASIRLGAGEPENAERLLGVSFFWLMASATVISQFLSLLWVLRFFRGPRCLIRIRRRFLTPGGALTGNILMLGSAPAFMVGSEGLLLLCFNLQMGRFGGAEGIAVMTILSSLFQLLLLPMVGLYQGAQPVVSFNYGAGNFGRVRRAILLAGAALCVYTILTCMFFAAISGSGPATVAAIGMLTIPAMVERGYGKVFSAIIVACAGIIGVLIPPSNPFIVYGVPAKVSIGKFFMAGILPGVPTGGALMVYSYFYCCKKGWRGTGRPFSWRRILTCINNAKWGLMVPVIILGGIYGGVMTPTESAAIAAAYGLIVGVFVYKGINRKNFIPLMVDCGVTSAVVIMLQVMAGIFGSVVAIESTPQQIAHMMLNVSNNIWVILIIINLFLLFIGTFMEPASATIILTPILVPIVVGLGMDPIHFGVIMTLNVAIAFVTPPVGPNLFVASSVSGCALGAMSPEVVPMLLVLLVVLVLVCLFPSISLVLTQNM